MDLIFGLQFRSILKCQQKQFFMREAHLCKYYSGRLFESTKIKKSVELLKNVCVLVI